MNIKFNLRDFSNLDYSEKADFLIRSMEVHYELESMRSIKRRALTMLDINPGDSVIELGCGLGVDAELLGELAYDGAVSAVDISKKMLKEATSRSKRKNVTYALSDACTLPYANNSFSKCRLERLLISQKNVDKVFQEAKRVTKINGKICITDLDFSTIFLYPVSRRINRIVRGYWAGLVRNPLIARKLPFLFLKNKMTNLLLQPEIFIVQSYKTLKEIVEFEVMLNDMQALQKITRQEKESVIDAFEKADIAGNFFWSINLLSIVGTKTAD